MVWLVGYMIVNDAWVVNQDGWVVYMDCDVVMLGVSLGDVDG